MPDDTLGLAQTIGPVLADTLRPATAPDAASVGATLTGLRFQVGREIGRGGMGRVLEATDLQFRRPVAIKELLGLGNPEAKQRFLTEALVTGNLEHPGIPAVYERGDRPDGTSYYAMQLVVGRTLGEALREAASLDERLRLLPAVVKVAQTVAYAHERGVVHRDLKPENVLLGRHGEVFLLDWGIAKVRGLASQVGSGPVTEGAGTQVGTLMGSPMYMAPEQARGATDAVDEQTDVFALGAMLYHVLTGRAPYQGSTVMEVTTRAAEARPPAVAELAPEVNPVLAAICNKAMQRLPTDRHRTALAFASDIEAFQSQAATRPVSRWLAAVQSAGLGAATILMALFLALGLAGAIAILRLNGAAPVIALVATATSLGLAVVELQTRGRARLLGVGLSMALVTFAIGAGEFLVGVIHTTEALVAPGLSSDVPGFLLAAAKGLGEVAYVPFASVPLGLAQVVVWALIARRLPERSS